MDIEKLTPTKLDGVKRLANRIKKAERITHTQALDKAARQTGFANYRDAREMIGAIALTTVRLTGHFNDAGERKTLVTHIQTSRALTDFLRNADISGCERFHSMEMRAPDHMEGFFGRAKEDYVRSCIAKTARTIQFMDATGLKLARTTLYGRRKHKSGERLPGQDHGLHWQDPQTKRLILMDEPYRYSDTRRAEREHWCALNGYTIERLSWGGTYHPDGNEICELITHPANGIPIADVTKKLVSARAGFVASKAEWTLHDGAHFEATPAEMRSRG